MAVEKARAIVIRTVPFGETSAVVTLCSRELGKVRALAKGAWRPKSSFDGGLDLLSTCQVLVLRRPNGGLDLLTEASLETRFRVGRSVAAVAAGMHVAELLDGLTADADPQPDLFDVAHETLRECSGVEQDDHVAARLVQTELAMLRIVGHAPALDVCADCGAAIPDTGRTAFGLVDGGSLCGRCRGGRRLVISVSAAARAALRQLATAGPERPDLPARVAGEVRGVMNGLLAHLLGRPLRASAAFQPRRQRHRPPHHPGS